MKKKYVFGLIIILYFSLSLYLGFFVLYKTKHTLIKISNVSGPITNSSNIYAISFNEQIVQNLNAIKSAFFQSNYQNFHISNVSSFINTIKNNQSGSVPLCSPLISSSNVECTSLSSIYPKIKSKINKLNIDLTSPHNISNYYIVKFQGNYYFINDNYKKTIYNNGFPIYYIH